MTEPNLSDMTKERDELQNSLNEKKIKSRVAEMKYDTDFKQLNIDVARSYDLGFNQALEQAKFFNPSADMSNCDFLKELVKGVLVVLGNDEDEDANADISSSEKVVDSQSPEISNPTEDMNTVTNED
ncbi:hypothetical protein SESBI_05085 [Sesbania bispinosa]|nr:hypothetical protein SESBI_05085 [Sesbania bispinosa]